MFITHHIDFKEQLTDFDCFIIHTALECFVEHMEDIDLDMRKGNFDFSQVDNSDDFKDFVLYSKIYGSFLIDKFKKYVDGDIPYES